MAGCTSGFVSPCRAAVGGSMSLERLRLKAVDGMRPATLSPISLSMHETDRLRTAAAWRPSAVEVRAHERRVAAGLLGILLVVPLLLSPSHVNAVSGGVADFVDVQGQDLSGKDFSKKDFSGCAAKEAKFVGTKLRGTRFFKADLTGADFTGADLSTASLEDAKLDGVVLKNAILSNSYTNLGLDKVKDISGADFTDALVRPDILAKLCKRSDATGTNPVTKADTRESLGC
ncbi:hypothetical protein GUITHDRAFT_97823, partial [Guillardia theta CCMP2712]